MNATLRSCCFFRISNKLSLHPNPPPQETQLHLKPFHASRKINCKSNIKEAYLQLTARTSNSMQHNKASRSITRHLDGAVYTERESFTCVLLV